jgi:hypothetical protein
MSIPNVSRLQRAASHIDATDLGDGRWAHYADETSRWYVVTADELEELCDYLDDEAEQISSDAYSHWCAGSSSEEMPGGWTPDIDPTLELVRSDMGDGGWSLHVHRTDIDESDDPVGAYPIVASGESPCDASGEWMRPNAADYAAARDSACKLARKFPVAS